MDHCIKNCIASSMNEFDKFGIHESIVIGNVKHVNRLESSCVRKVSQDSSAMLLLHHKDHIRPGDINRRNRMNRIASCAARSHIQSFVIEINRFRRRTSPLIATANEQHIQSRLAH